LHKALADQQRKVALAILGQSSGCGEAQYGAEIKKAETRRVKEEKTKVDMVKAGKTTLPLRGRVLQG
jgi:hypothetical protein